MHQQQLEKLKLLPLTCLQRMALCLSATTSPSLTFHTTQSKAFSSRVLTQKFPRKFSPANISCQQEILTEKAVKAKTFKGEEIRRADFPVDFMFGASSSAIQTEGFSNGGRGPTTWDNMVKGFSGDPKMDIAIDSYHRYKEDVQMLKNMSADCYRFSISWSRILPKGSGEINQDGIHFYNNLINELVDNGIEPVVTLFHYDLPQALQDSYRGFMNIQIVEDFKNFADICFKNFGDRVKYWTTFNEPQIFSIYGDTSSSPGQEPPSCYKAIHHMILAHATAYKLYKDTYYKAQGGEFGFPMIIQGFLPFSSSPSDISAAKRASDFYMGWILKPLTTGDYPFVMRVLVKDKLPQFSDDEKKLIKGSFDFITVNYYTSRFTQSLPFDPNHVPGNHEEDQHVKHSVVNIDGKPIGPLPRGDTNAYLYPEGLRHALLELKNHYGNPKTFISENGIMEPMEENLRLSVALKDTHRIKYIRSHLKHLQEAIEEGVNVKAYCYWSLNDSLELASGNTVRMGLNYTAYDNDLKRIPKDSAKWFGNFLRNGTNGGQ